MTANAFSPAPLTPGLLVLHGNRLEDLAAVVLQWLSEHPLAPLEEETLLVQSNGMAEWLKMEVAAAQGVCAAARVELPARFVWRAYRAVLGRDAVPAVAPLDKLPLTWRLMSLLPTQMHEPVFAPVAGFLGTAAEPLRRLQLAQRLADLFDQYQVYRSDWLHDWQQGDDVLRSATGAPVPVPEAQRWQPALWRAVLQTLSDEEHAAARPALHQRFMRTLEQGAPAGVPRRVVLFGTTHIPHQTLQALAALSLHSQVLLAVPNPCRHHWADLIEGRELLGAERRRHAARPGRDLAALPLEQLHAHGHPLLAAWGRQSRDFIRQLDAYDDVQAAQQRFALPRVDLFDDGPGTTLLQQMQARIRDLVPLAEHANSTASLDDRSIVFHSAHSAQREVEVLHDQLLRLLAPGELAPRDIVVMVPDIDAFAPAIRSVFGQHARGDARFIPWGIADQRERRHNPLLAALEWLLRAPQQRFTATELLGLLEVPAVARRFGLREGDLPVLQGWVAAAGIRWGLDEAQRGQLGLQACGDANTWAFGLQRMLLGYAVGERAADAVEDAAQGEPRAQDAAARAGGDAGVVAALAAIEPCAEVGGLAAHLSGTLAELLSALQAWWSDAAQPRPPAAWGQRLRELLATLLRATGEAERQTLAALDDALAAWLQACDAAAFSEAIELDVVREAWLDAVDEPGLSQRFKAGGVTFCTLLPLRAIPFEVVCLLGMNDGDYPRRATRSDFDLMGLPGQARPGDRSRRDDDRQLMLDALLSARRVLYVSWAGRSQRDNQEQPPSVLVAQLRDYLDAGWGAGTAASRTTEHPLQPFSRAYFEGRGGLFTYAAEWRAAFDEAANDPAAEDELTAAEMPDEATALTLSELERFLRNPVKTFFRRRLNVVFDEAEATAEDDEPFESGGLQRWRQIDQVLGQARRALGEGTAAAAAPEDPQQLQRLVDAQVARLQREGSLPLAGPGVQARLLLQQTLQPMLAQWRLELARRPQRHDKMPLRLAHPTRSGVRLEDWLVGLRSGGAAGEAGDRAVWVDLRAGKLANKQRKVLRADKLMPAWLRLLAAAACGGAGDAPVGAVLIGSDVVVTLPPIADGAEARRTLLGLMEAWADQGHAAEPLPTALRVGLEWLKEARGEGGKPAAVYNGGQGGFGEREDECLSRLFPDFETLRAQPAFEAATERLYGAFRAWVSVLPFEPLPDAVADDEDDEA